MEESALKVIVRFEGPECWLCGSPLPVPEMEHFINDERVCRGCFARARAQSRKPRGLMARLVAVVTGDKSPEIRLRRI